ncbi:hypothetical protein [Streptomyces sp. NPDC094149]|uniref:hypothetical protein n=1 Tax=Streptomyces sp. NPDC094149 TaxID=3155079 RepID=UPI0033330B01
MEINVSVIIDGNPGVPAVLTGLSMSKAAVDSTSFGQGGEISPGLEDRKATLVLESSTTAEEVLFANDVYLVTAGRKEITFSVQGNQGRELRIHLNSSPY